jgi:hypothetical protein
MLTDRSAPRAVLRLLVVTGLLSGCAQPGSLLAPRTTVGSLKTSLSHLEYENEQLHREVAQLKSENRAIEDRLVQEEAVNGDLAARLDDARNLLSQQGLDPGGELDGRRMRPAGRSNRGRRKPPFARIPARIDTDPPPAPGFEGPAGTPDASGTWRQEDLGPQGWLQDHERWLPVAQDPSGSGARVR